MGISRTDKLRPSPYAVVMPWTQQSIVGYFAGCKDACDFSELDGLQLDVQGNDSANSVRH